jgi:ATP-dependent DNA ligase
MMATLVDEPFSRDGWLFERMLDGERCLAFRAGRALRLCSRTRRRLDDVYPELVEPLLAQAVRQVRGRGEIVAFEDARSPRRRTRRGRSARRLPTPFGRCTRSPCPS